MEFPKIWYRGLRHLRGDFRSARGTPGLAPALVDRALGHYDSFYLARSAAAQSDPVWAFTTPWATALERATYWLAGWRPTTFIHLLYSESGLRFEAHLDDLLRFGFRSGDLGDLNPGQLARLDELQRQTVAEEDEIAAEMVAVQEGLATEPFAAAEEDALDLEEKARRLAGVMGRADKLRMRTLRAVVRVLEPAQAVDLLAAAAELELGIRRLGLEHERGRVGC